MWGSAKWHTAPYRTAENDELRNSRKVDHDARCQAKAANGAAVAAGAQEADAGVNGTGRPTHSQNTSGRRHHRHRGVNPCNLDTDFQQVDSITRAHFSPDRCYQTGLKDPLVSIVDANPV